MCLALFVPTTATVSISNLKRGWTSNDDGAGYCFVDEHGEIIIKKFMTWESFESAYVPDSILYGDNSPFLIHFRITSKGVTSIDNCHPFKVNDDIAIIHNGTMSNITIESGDTRSDTKIFAEEYLANIGDAIVDNAYIFALAEGFIGYSKVCILHRKRGVFILNEKLGHWNADDGCWYSNESYKPKPVIPPYKPLAPYVAPKTNGWDRPDSYYDSYYRKPEVASATACDWCKTEAEIFGTVTVTDCMGYDIPLCEMCYEEWKEVNKDIICQDCKESLLTNDYNVVELDEEVCLCYKCKLALGEDHDFTLVPVLGYPAAKVIGGL